MLHANPLIWVIGGTQESRELAVALAQANLPCLITVTTSAARSLYPTHAKLSLWVGRLTPEALPAFLQTHRISCILDASHPYAVAISQLAIDASIQFQLPYLRYERPLLPEPEPVPESKITGTQPLNLPNPPILHLNSFATLLQGAELEGERVLLTVGYRFLTHFQSWHNRAILFARILPSVTALEAALAAGFTPDRLIALRPPLTADLERALWQQWQISTVVTKASGVAGGEDIKRQVAADLGIRLVMIDRPLLSYPQQTSQIQEAIDFCQRHFSRLNRQIRP